MASMTHADAGVVLNVLQYAYPLTLLFFFLLAFTARSIANSSASNSSDSEQPLFGPGGKPLPTNKKAKRSRSFDTGAEISRSRKLVFEWLSAFACFTWIANTAEVIVHAVINRKQHWWCGRSVVVSSYL